MKIRSTKSPAKEFALQFLNNIPSNNFALWFDEAFEFLQVAHF